MTPSELADKLGLYGMKKSRQWYIQGTTAVTGDGLYEGMDWLVRAVEEKQKART